MTTRKVQGLRQRVSRITPAGVTTRFLLNQGTRAAPAEIAARPGGNIWITDFTLAFIYRLVP